MGLPDNIFGSDKSSPVPGGNVAKPLIIALLALLASRYMSGKGNQQPGTPAPAPTPRSPDPVPSSDPSPGSVLDGLGGLIKQFQQKGLNDTIDTWINPGANKDISSGQVSDALGPDVVDELSRRTGLSRDQVVAELARMLPNVVDKLTPDGRLPTRAEIQRLMG
jgi:uncharacterized protein YidB (DUF937 family)